MHMVLCGLIILHLLIYCSALEYKEENGLDFSQDISNNNTINCDEFFHGKPWPIPQDTKDRGIVKLCQTQLLDNRMGKSVFATLFSTKERIPVYSANTVTLEVNALEYARPAIKYWERVAQPLCAVNHLPTNPVPSNLAYVDKATLETCRKFQAVCDDYKSNGMHLDRGHLSPNSINSQDQEKQQGTFTLTNAAPQFALFNRNSWRVYECVTKQAILKFVPGEKVFIITGTYGSILDNNGNPLWMNGEDYKSDFHKNPVKIPGYYWKAVCYPGNKEKKKKAWGYAIVKENVNQETIADHESYLSLKEFSDKFFYDPPFGPECMKAKLGEFQTLFPNWKRYLQDKCDPSKFSKKEEL